MKYLLDPNVISELRKGARANPNVRDWAAAANPLAASTSVIALGEIRRGIELKRLKDPAHAEALDAWFDGMRQGFEDRVLPVDEVIAGVWARLNVPNPLPFVDGLLAATALTRRLVLVTRNTRDMTATGVRILNPFLPPGDPAA